MANNGKVGGIAYVKFEGIQYPLRGNLKYSPCDREAEEVVGQDGSVHGFKETGKAPFIDMDVTDRGDMSIVQINRMSNATITAELNNGKVFILKGAKCLTQIENDTAEGMFNVRFAGTDGREITSNG